MFGGVLVRTKDARDREVRKYLAVERGLGEKAGRTKNGELKATTLCNRDKYQIYRSLNAMTWFAVVVHQKNLLSRIFNNKKTKQRYLDYAFKIGLKRALLACVEQGIVEADYAGHIEVRMDEHTTATDGRYELCEGLDQEFRLGTYNQQWDKFYPPVFPQLRQVSVEMRDSEKDALIRAADIVANRVYYHAIQGTLEKIEAGVIIKHLP